VIVCVLYYSSLYKNDQVNSGTNFVIAHASVQFAVGSMLSPSIFGSTIGCFVFVFEHIDSGNPAHSHTALGEVSSVCDKASENASIRVIKFIYAGFV
jgi:hypothetical protein